MAKSSSKSVRLTIGLDLGNDVAHFCVLGESDTALEEGRVPLTRQALFKRFGKQSPALFALEAGTQSAWVDLHLRSLGHEVLVAQPRKLRMIYENPKKCDRIDAYQLAYFARSAPKALCPIEHRSPETQAELSLLNARDAVVGARTKLVNVVRGMAKVFGTRLSKSSTRSFAKKAGPQLPEALEGVIEPMLHLLSTISETIDRYDEEIEKRCASKKHRDSTAAVRQISGVGPVTSLHFISRIENPRRFKRSREVGAYVGLAPRRDQSGGRDPELGITKAGDPRLRRLLIQAAHYILGPHGPESDLRDFGLRLASRGGKSAKKKAIVATARKLAVLMHRLWITGEKYEPLRRRKQAAAAPAAPAGV
ncbi:MAG: IS110 family transposase [Planctomycetes bacterium]|nr:IS110 family transposase [Planctomycetota bacterium]